MKLGRPAWIEARQTIQSILSAQNPLLRDDQNLRKKAFIEQSKAEMHLPAQIGEILLLI